MSFTNDQKLVKNCEDCPFSVGDSAEYCAHPKVKWRHWPKEGLPPWCPLKKNPILVKLEEQPCSPINSS